MPLPTQQEFFKDSSFNLFSELPSEIQNQIWKICVKDYPARIVDLREYRVRTSQSMSPGWRIELPPINHLSYQPDRYHKVRNQPPDDVLEIAGFKTRALRPTVLYICRNSRYFAKEAYTKAFGTAAMPAQTWFDFEKDMLYVSKEFCHLSLGKPWSILDRSHTGRKPPYGYFFNDLDSDMRKVRDFAVGGLRNLNATDRSHHDLYVKWDIAAIIRLFTSIERFTLVDAQHAPDRTGNLAFTHDSPYMYPDVRRPDHDRHYEFRDEQILESRYFQEIWGGAKPFPWFEFGALVERSQDNTTSDIRPRKADCLCISQEDRQRVLPNAKDRAWASSLSLPEILAREAAIDTLKRSRKFRSSIKAWKRGRILGNRNRNKIFCV